MNRIFLGKPVHWAVVAVLIVGGWILGRMRLHVTNFNEFVILLLVVSVAVLAIVLKTSRPHEQVTRDPIEPDES